MGRGVSEETDIRAKFGINTIAVKRECNISAFPAGDYGFLENDVIVVFGGSDTVKTV